MSARFSFALISTLLIAGCSGSDDSPGATNADTGVKPDATTDAPGSDTGAGDTGAGDTGAGDAPAAEDAAGVKCGSTTCPVGQVCCVSGDPDAGFSTMCATSCADGGGSLKCDGPEDCMGGQHCCGDVEVKADCTFTSGVSECKATCTSSIPTMCEKNATVRLCHKPSDCTEAGYSKCCLFESGGTEAEFCANDVAAFAAKSCK